MPKHFLLVEPSYYTSYPPIGLLKLSSYHKENGDTTEYIRGCKNAHTTPSKIYITSLFTWTWRPVWEAVKFYKTKYPHSEVWLGGIYATLLSDHAYLSGADHVFKGIFEETEDLMPDYSLVPKWDGSIIFSSRGCCNKCDFCAVPIIEGKMNSLKSSIIPYVYPGHSKIIFFDNNILANRNWKKIFAELKKLQKKVDFNQGIDASLVSEGVADMLSQLKLDSSLRLAYDNPNQRKYVERAIERLTAAGIKQRDLFVYALFNYNESPDEFLERVRDILNWGVVCYPMRYEPLFTLEKNIFISPKWDAHKIELIQHARRVIGYGGAFPPYEGLVKKFNDANDFDEAFGLREEKRGNNK